jgi:ferredoxin
MPAKREHTAPRRTMSRRAMSTKRAREMAPSSGGVRNPPPGTQVCGRCGQWGEVAAEVWWWCATCVQAAPDVFTFEERAADSIICNDLQSRNEWLEEQLELLKAQLKAANEKAGKFDELQRILSS